MANFQLIDDLADLVFSRAVVGLSNLIILANHNGSTFKNFIASPQERSKLVSQIIFVSGGRLIHSENHKFIISEVKFQYRR